MQETIFNTEEAGSAGILRIDFGEPGASLEEISWEEFFVTFVLALLYEDTIPGRKPSRLSKFVHRE